MTRGVRFWNDETIRLVRQHFIAAAVPTWVCRSDSPEGEFLRRAGVHKQWVTSSGYMTCLSASGAFLGRRPSQEVLERFKALPESQRKPGAVKVRDLRPEERIIPSPPQNGLVLRVHARFLVREKDGRLRRATTTDFPLMRNRPKVAQLWQLFLQPNVEYMWLTEKEWKSLIPSEAKAGRSVDVPDSVVIRMARFHLTPQRATTSEGGVVPPRKIKTAEAKVTLSKVTPDNLYLELTGKVHWGSDFDPASATSPNGPLRQGFATRLYGRIEYDRSKRAITRFDIVAPGEVWGRWGDANGKSMYVERPGKAPFGFAFELATGDSPTDRIPPGGNGRYVLDRGYLALKTGS